MFEKIKKLCKIGIESGEFLLENTIKTKDKKNYVKGRVSAYKLILKYIETLEKEEKK